MPKVIIPPPYRGPTGGRAELSVDAGTVKGCLEAVEREHAGFLAQVLDAEGRVHRFVKLFVNGEQLEEGLDAPLGPEDQVEIVAAIAGG